MEFRLFVELAVAAAPALVVAAATDISTGRNATSAVGAQDAQFKGTRLSSEGPAPLPPGGSILDDPDLVWTEDLRDEKDEEEALARIGRQGKACDPFWRSKYIQDTGRNWNEFYKRNKDKFYKDRHYLHLVFPELLPSDVIAASDGEKPASTPPALTLLEVGCGVGNAVFPLLELNPSLFVYAIDHAKSAVTILKDTAAKLNLGERVAGSMCNVVTEPVPAPPGSLDIVLCMFVLSAIAPEFHVDVLKKLTDALKPGGKLLIRDYGRYDEAQLRFAKGAKLSDNFYVRQDGTCSYFFAEEELRSLVSAVTEAGGSVLEVEECHAIKRQYANRKQKVARRRVWMHVKILKK